MVTVTPSAGGVGDGVGVGVLVGVGVGVLDVVAVGLLPPVTCCGHAVLD